MLKFSLPVCLLLLPLAACGPTYSPNTYATNAAQQANKTEQGVIIGVRAVRISAAGTVGTVTGAAAGGIAGSQAGVGPTSAFAALGGSLIGGLTGSAVEHATADADAYEYIVKKSGGELVSVTQKDAKPLPLGSHVLVIAGVQARITVDYTVPTIADDAKTGTAEVAKAPAAPKPPAEAAPKTDALPPSVSAMPVLTPSVAAGSSVAGPAGGAPGMPAAVSAAVAQPSVVPLVSSALQDSAPAAKPAD